MNTFRYNLVFQPEPKGGFTVTVPALPGCVTYGKNLVEAKAMAEDAILGYLQSLKKNGKSIPTDDNSFIGTTEINLPGGKVKKISYV